MILSASKVLALDLSLTSAGFAKGDPVETGILKPPKKQNSGMDRLEWFLDQILSKISGTYENLVVMEGYAYAAKYHGPQMGELGGIIKFALWKRCIPFTVIPPSTLKKFATGKGNAGKDEIIAEAVRRLNFQGHDNNEADAMWLREAALQHYGLSEVKLPKVQLEALSKVEWPKLKT